MGLFHFARKKRVPVPSAAAQSDTAPLDLQAFSLEPILTPSGLVDAPDHTLNGMDWVDHPGTDWHNSDLAALPDSRHVDVTPAHTTDASAAHPTATGDHDLVLSGSGYGSAQTETTAQPLTGGGYGDAGTQAPTTQSDDGHANTPVSTTPTAPTATTTTVLPAVDHAIASPASASVVGAAVAPQPLVGIIDTGFAAQNPHLDYSHITLGHDYVDGDNNPLLQPGRGNDHGTGILGIVEATQNHGVEGLHEATPIWLGRATGSGHWADSLVEFVNHAQATGTPHAVVNLSFDLTQTNPDGSVSTRFAFTPQELAALHYAHDNQILIVTAAGNQGGAMSALGQASQPFDNIITVGAADGMGRADYSSYGAGLDLLANGGTPEHPILTTMGEGRGAVAGSSAAAAQVTGAVSLVWQANPGLSYRQVIDLLEHAATDVGTAGWDATTGFGVINLAAASDLAKQIKPDVATASTAVAADNLIPIPWATSDDLTTGERPTDDWSEPLPETTSENGAGTGTDATGEPPPNAPEGDTTENGSEPTGDGTNSALTVAAPYDLSLFHPGMWRVSEDGVAIPPAASDPTNSSTALIQGKVLSGVTVQLLEAGQEVGQATTAGAGYWFINTTVLPDGVHTLTAIATDASGMVSPPSDPLVITIDTQPPTTPTIQLSPSSDSGSSDSDLQTNATTFLLSGTADPGLVVDLSHNGLGLGRVTAAADGTWQTTVTQRDAVLYQGEQSYAYTITAETTDAAGNTSSSTPLPIVFYRATATPVIQGLATSNNWSLHQTEGSTRVSHPTLKGQADAGTVITLFSDDAQLVGQATTDDHGLWQITTSNFETGTHYLRAVATDVAGNTSASHPFELTITLLDNLSGSGYGGEGNAGAGGGYGGTGYGGTGYGGTGYGGTGYGSGGNSSSSHPGTTPPNPADDPDNAFVDHAPTQPTDDPASDPGDGSGGNSGSDPTGNSSGNPTTPPLHTGATPDDYPPPSQESLDVNYTTDFGLMDAQDDFYGDQPYGYSGRYRPTQPSVAFHGAPQFTFLPDVYWQAYYRGYYRQDPPDPNDPHNAGNPPLGPDTPAPSPDDPNQPPPLTYSEKLQGLLAQADSQLLGKRQAALTHYTGTLTALGNVVNTGQFYSFLSPVLGGVFNTANFIQRRYEIKDSGYTLYWNLRHDDASITEQVYQAKLLTAVKLAQVPKLEEHLNDPAFITDLKALGSVYALSYATATVATAEDASNRSFLTALWVAEDETSLQQGVAKLEQALQAAEDPAKVLHLLRTLLEAAQQVPALKTQLHDAKLIDQFVQLGLNYAALETEPASGQEPLWFCLDTLWNAQSPAEVRLGAKELTTFFQDLTSDADRFKALTLDNNLLKAIQQVPALQEQSKDPAFIQALLALGNTYAATQPGGQQPIQCFLDILYHAKDDTAIALGAQELTTFLQGFDTKEQRLQLLQFETKLIQTADQVPALQGDWLHDPTFTQTLVNLGRTYASVQPSEAPPPGDPLNFFLDTVWRAQSKADLTQGATELATFVQDVANPARELSFANSLIETAKFASNLQAQQQETKFWAELVRLGKDYATVNPAAPSGTADEPLHFFLDTLWQAESEPDREVVDKSVAELKTFLFQLDDPEQRAQFLEFESRLLELLEQIPVLRQIGLKDPKFIQEVLGAGQLYAALKFSPTSPPGPQAGGSFLDLLWQGQPVQGEPLQQAQTFFEAMGPAAVNPEAVTLGLRLLTANERRAVVSETTDAEGNPVTTVSPDLTVPLAQLARAYAALDPEKQPGYPDFFLNTLWSTSNAAEMGTLEQIDLGAQELQAFLVGADPTKPTFAPADQPKVLEFEAKLLKAAKMSPETVLGAQQRQDPDTLKKFVDLGKNSAQFHLTDAQGAGNSTFLGTLWNAPLQDNAAIKQGVKELGQYLKAYGLTIDSFSYLNKVLLALKGVGNQLKEDAFAGAEELNQFIHQNLGLILAACGVIGGLLAVPATAPFVAAFLAILDVALSVWFGIQSIGDLFKFLLDVNAATDEAGIDVATKDLAHAIESGAVAALGIQGLFKSFATLTKAGATGLKLIQEIFEFGKLNPQKILPVAKFFDQFYLNGTARTFIFEAVGKGKTAIQELLNVTAYLAERDKVLKLLADLKDERLLKDVLEIGTKAIDDLAAIVDTGATADQILKLRFEVKGMSLTKLRQLLEKPGMQPDILVNLFNKLSISQLEDLLSIAGMSPRLLLDLLDKPGITASTLKALLARINVSPESLLKALNNNVKVKDLEYLSNLPGMSATKLQSLSDAEFQAAAEAARIERLDGGHSLARHGVQVDDAALQARITTGMTPDGVVSPFSPSTKFKSYTDWLETRQQVLDQAFQAVEGVDLKYGPGAGGNSMQAEYDIIVEFSSRDLGEGFYGTGSKIKIPDPRGPKPSGSRRPDLNVWTGTAPINSGINRTFTQIKWMADPTLANGGRWIVKQHIPYAKEFDFATNTYTKSADYIIP